MRPGRRNPNASSRSLESVRRWRATSSSSSRAATPTRRRPDLVTRAFAAGRRIGPRGRADRERRRDLPGRRQRDDDLSCDAPDVLALHGAKRSLCKLAEVVRQDVVSVAGVERPTVDQLRVEGVQPSTKFLRHEALVDARRQLRHGSNLRDRCGHVDEDAVISSTSDLDIKPRGGCSWHGRWSTSMTRRWRQRPRS